MNKLTLELTPQELDYIANVLAERPWKETNALMVNIQNQVQTQQITRGNGHDHASTAEIAQALN
jgi:hypothetical protein